MKRKEIEHLAHICKLQISYWSPGDGMTRYRFHSDEQCEGVLPDFDGTRSMGTALGAQDASAWLRGYAAAYYQQHEHIIDLEYQVRKAQQS